MHVFEYFQRFRDRCRDLEDGPKSGALSTAWNSETVAKVCEVVSMDYWMNLKLTKDQLHTNSKKICHILHAYFGKKEIHSKLNCTQLGQIQTTTSYNHTIFTNTNAEIEKPIWGYKRQRDRLNRDTCFYFRVKILLFHTINLLKVTHPTKTTFKSTKSRNILEQRLQYLTFTNILEVNDGQLKKDKTKTTC